MQEDEAKIAHSAWESRIRTDIHYAMPVREHDIRCLAVRKAGWVQIQFQIAKMIKVSRNGRGNIYPDFKQRDVLETCSYACDTFWSGFEWDAPLLSLHEMMGTQTRN